MEQVKLSYKATEKDLVYLSVYNVGNQKCGPLHQWGPGIRDHYLIHYIVSGKGTYIQNNHKHSLSAGDCFIVYPNTEVTYCADKSEPWEYSWIGFSGADAPLILSSTNFSVEHPYITNIAHGRYVKDSIANIYEASGNDLSSAILMSGRLYELLALFVADAHKDSTHSTAKYYVQKSIEYISANYSYPISIDDVSEFVGISRSQLYRCFESVLNQSPKEYLSHFRIKQACLLLTNTSLSVTTIANSLGYDTSLYFSKAFKKIKGVSPRDYRNQKNNYNNEYEYKDN